MEGEATQEAIRVATTHQAKERNTLSTIEVTQGRSSANSWTQPTEKPSDTKAHALEITAAEQAARALDASSRQRSPS